MRNARRTRIPHFETEEQEREFWSTHDSIDYVDWSSAQEMEMPNLRPTLRSISLRLPESLLERLRALANKKDVPYQSLMKMYLSEKVEQEITTSARPSRKVRVPGPSKRLSRVPQFKR